MASHASNKDGAGGDGAAPGDAGLDARLDRAVPSGEPEAFLIGMGGSHGGRLYPLVHNTVYVGRAADADILINEASVSGRHARIINGSQGFEIEDLGSSNGTRVEGRRIERAPLRSGDSIALGQVAFKFLLDKRIDATMTIIPAGVPTGTRPSGALIRYEPPRERAATNWPGAAPFAPAAPRDEDEGPSLEEIVGRLAKAYRFLGKNARFIGVFIAAGAFLGLLSVFALPTPRQAVCVLKLQPELKANPVDAQWNRNPNSEEQEVRFFANPEVAFVRADLVGGTLTKLFGHKPSDGTVGYVAERLKIEALADNGYRATYKEKMFGSAPVGPAELLTAHIDNYLHTEIARAIRVFTAQTTFLRDQMKTVEGEMKSIADQKMQFSRQNADRLPEEVAPMVGSRFTLETKRADLNATIRRLQGDLDAQRRALVEEGPLAQGRYKTSQTYRESLATVNRKLTELYAKGLADGHPEVRQLKDEKERLDGLIATEMTTETTQLDRASNAGFQELKTKVALLQGQLSAARSDLSDTEKSLSRLQNVVGDLPRVQAGVQQLNHMQEATTQLHGQLFEQLKKAELQLNLERVSAESRYEVVSPPRLIKAGRVSTAGIRIFIGALVGVLLAFATIGAKMGRRMFSQALSKLDTSPSGTR